MIDDGCVIASARSPARAMIMAQHRTRPNSQLDTSPRRHSYAVYVWSGLCVAGSAVMAAGLRESMGMSNLSMLFLPAVLVAAVRWGLRASIVASMLSVFVYNYFFVPPLYTLTIASPEHVLELIVLLIVAVMTSNLAGRARDHAVASRMREAQTAALYDLSRRIAGEIHLDAMSQAIAEGVAKHLNASALLFVAHDERLVIQARYPCDTAATDTILSRADAAFEDDRIVDSSIDGDPADDVVCVPLRSVGRPIGVIALAGVVPADLGVEPQRRLVEAFADLAAVAIERARQASLIERAALLTERERLQGLLLSSISHDLRTPLASIIGSATSLLEGGERYSEEVRRDLAMTVRDEGERLNRFVRNLLDMTRLEAGSLRLKSEWLDLADVLGAAVRAMTHRLADFRVEIALHPDLPLVLGDFVFIEQVIVNVLDNASRYSPAGSVISIRTNREADAVTLVVEDEGVGIPASELDRVFEKFYRTQQSDAGSAGTGLGLSICRGIMAEHAGEIDVASPIRDGRGTRVTLRFPLADCDPLFDQTMLTS